MHDSNTARDVMRHEFVGVSESDTLGAAASLLVEEESDSVIVLHGTEPVGRLSVHDMLAALLEGDPERTVDTIMERSVATVDTDTELSVIRDRIVTEDIASLLVVNGEGPVGVVTDRDLLLARGDAGGAPDRPETNRSEGVSASGSRLRSGPEHGICEVCGSLSAELMNVNGQMQCPDCRSV
ncbi:MAG: CBS domain-containing protein [Halobacteriota archaeon]